MTNFVWFQKYLDKNKINLKLKTSKILTSNNQYSIGWENIFHTSDYATRLSCSFKGNTPSAIQLSRGIFELPWYQSIIPFRRKFSLYSPWVAWWFNFHESTISWWFNFHHSTILAMVYWFYLEMTGALDILCFHYTCSFYFGLICNTSYVVLCLSLRNGAITYKLVMKMVKKCYLITSL